MVDWVGQRVCEIICETWFILVGVVGFMVAYATSDLQMIFYVTLAGLAIAMLVCVPNWPFFNRYPVKFQDPVDELVESVPVHSILSASKSASKKKTTKKR